MRLPTLDLARFCAMFMMMMGHSVFALTSPAAINMNDPFWMIWEFLRGMTAPLFLTVSGIVHVFANKRDESGLLPKNVVKKRIKTALMLLGVGYLLVFPVARIYDLPFLSQEAWKLFFQVNVLQMFGISLLLLLVLNIISKTEQRLMKWSLIIGLSIFFATPLVQMVNWFGFMPEFAGAYLSLAHGSLFPIFPFSGFIFIGTFMGLLLKKQAVEDRTNFIINRFYLFGALFMIVGIPLFVWISKMPVANFDIWKVSPGLILIRAGFVLMLLSGFGLLYKATRGISKYYSLFGKRAIYIYVIHLILIYGSPITPGFETFYKLSLSPEYGFVCAAIIVASTLLITYLYDRSVNSKNKAKIFYKYALTAYLIYVLFI